MMALVDGDILVYRVGFSTEGLSSSIAKARMTALVNKLVSRVNATDFKVFLTCAGPQFRSSVAVTKPYKGNRKAPKPTHYLLLREHLQQRFKAQVSVFEEADDMLGYTACQLMAAGKPCVIISIDKDLKMIPGDHFNFIKGEYVTVTRRQARLNFYKQLITGDPTDNIPGYGRGAKKLIQTLSEDQTEDAQYEIVKKAYTERFGDEAEARLLEVATLLWIRREPSQMWSSPGADHDGLAQRRSPYSRQYTSATGSRVRRRSCNTAG